MALCLIGAAMLIRSLVPAGFMPVASHGVIYVQLCTGHGRQMIALEIPGRAPDIDHSGSANKDMACAFSGLAGPALSGADPIQLGLALKYIVSAVFYQPESLVLWRGIYLRPPAIGPPELA